ncbi:HEAT repeat domain-containing protein [Chamaesiphon sp. VAR_69_metabat_338]|uniref:HEAT repeat domain-containing protein n=1 Tax=Chamaesiphon sp. VAR_69_metabat_338 TaxID=2964704 RepID=UPI00286DB99F|nr:HEAT repeat domain-containing protein [Chamaesiphon sp. VAR_69_metabat_338]
MTEPDLLKILLQDIAEADSATRMVAAVERLAQAQLAAGIPHLITALGYNNPGAAVAAVEGLIAIGRPAVQPLLELLDGYNYGARAWGLRALAGIGDPQALDLLLDAAINDFALSVRRAAARGLGTLHWDELAPESIGSAQAKVATVLLTASQDHEWIVRYAAINGLQELAIASTISHPDLTQQILAHFDLLVDLDDNLAVIARIWLAQKNIQANINEILAQQPILEQQISSLQHTSDTNDWQATLEKLYARKRQQQTYPEGDPHKFREVAAAIFRGE